MRITSTTNAERVQHDGTVYEADGDGVFEVPEQVGEELTSFPGWLPEHEANARAAAAQAAADNDVTRLAARVAALEEWRASLDADADDTGEPKPKRTRTRKADTADSE